MRGLTLIELLISGSLGVAVIVVAVAMLLSAGRMRRNQLLLSDANEEARTTLRNVTRGLVVAGAGGASFQIIDADNNVRRGTALFFKNGVDRLAPASTYMKARPDELMMLRYSADRRTDLVGPIGGTKLKVAPDPRPEGMAGVTSELFKKYDSALITNFKGAMLVPVKSANLKKADNIVELELAVDSTTLKDALKKDRDSELQPGATVFPVQLMRYRLVYRPALKPNPERADLVMESLAPNSMFQETPNVLNTVVLARDIEDFQVQWAYDRDGDGAPDAAFSDEGPSATFLGEGLAFARISISARTSAVLMSEKGPYLPKGEMTPFEVGLDKELGGEPLATNDEGYRHRVMSTVVLLKNIAAPSL